MKCVANVENIPEYAKSFKYIVARPGLGRFWFYGAWNDEVEASDVADKVEGFVFEMRGE